MKLRIEILARPHVQVCIAVLFAACADDRTPPGHTVMRDSAGVTIVENGAPRWNNGNAWRVGAPVLDIGGLEDADYEFERIVNAVRIVGDRIAVADAGAHNIRIYDSLGSFLGSGGRKGEGPGEFKSVSGMIGYPGDSLAVYDAGTRRISLFDSDLAFGRSITITPPDETPGAAPVGVFGDGGWLLSGLPFGSFMLNRPPSGLARVGLVLFRYDPDVHKADRLREAPGMELHVWSEGGGIPQTSRPMFYRTSDVGMYLDGYYLASNDTHELRFYDPANRLVRIVRKAGVRQDVTAAARNAAGDDPLPDSLPAFGRPGGGGGGAGPIILVDSSDNVWVLQYHFPNDTPEKWDVFDPGGVLLGAVELPTAFSPLEVGEDYVLGVWQDADEIEHVRLYELEKPQ